MKLLFLIILTLNLNYSFGKYGGNDIFTSLEAMKILWARDIELVNKMETIIQNMKEVIPHMERYNIILHNAASPQIAWIYKHPLANVIA